MVERLPAGLKTLQLCGDCWHLSEEARAEGVYPDMQLKWPGELLHLHLEHTDYLYNLPCSLQHLSLHRQALFALPSGLLSLSVKCSVGQYNSVLRLPALPPGLRKLRLNWYDDSAQPRPELEVPQLPPALQELILENEGKVRVTHSVL